MYSCFVTEPDRPKVKIGAGALLEREFGEFLLERRRDNGLWGLPGGAVLPGETVAGAAMREIEEETGFIVKLTGFLGIYSDPMDGRIVCYPDNGDLAHIIDVVFLASIVSGALRASEESFELRFFTSKTLPSQIALPAIRPIRDFLERKSCQVR